MTKGASDPIRLSLHAPEACLLCGAHEPRELFRRDGKRFWICRTCDFVWVHDIYPEFAPDRDYADPAARMAVKAKQVRDYNHLLAEFGRYRARNRLLEVGCATGGFLEEAQRQGWSCTGVELRADAAALARQRRGLDVRTGELSAAGFPEDEFDVAYMNEVIEHVVDPVALMREVRRVLRPGGMALVRTGNARSWSARLRGVRWDYFSFGRRRHIRFYSPGAARSLASAAGFERVEARTRGFAFLEAAEARGRWFRPLMQIAQAPISQLAGPLGAGHRLTMRFWKG